MPSSKNFRAPPDNLSDSWASGRIFGQAALLTGILGKAVHCRWCGRSERHMDPETISSDLVGELEEKGISTVPREEKLLLIPPNKLGNTSLGPFNLMLLATFAELIPYLLPEGEENRDPKAGFMLLMRTLDLVIMQAYTSLGVSTKSGTISTQEQLFKLEERNVLPPKLLNEIRSLLDKRNLVIHSLLPAVTFHTLRQDANRVAELLSWYAFDFLQGLQLSDASLESTPKPPSLGAGSTRKIFLCYAREDTEKVLELYNRICERGHNPWMDKKNLLPRQDWENEIEQAIRASDFFIACISSASVGKRGFVQKEVRFAMEVLGEMPPGQIYLIPVLLETCDIPSHLRSLHWIKLETEDDYNTLFRAIEGKV
jgi:hypothetical protein